MDNLSAKGEYVKSMCGEKESRTVVIAEIGVNHNGDPSLAEQLIGEAYECGADYAKFQTFATDELATPTANLAEYQQSLGLTSQRDLLRSLELSESDFTHLKEFSEEVGIGFLSTAHDFRSAQYLFKLNLDYVKVPSGDLTNRPFLELSARQNKNLLLSTGMATLEEVGEALEVLETSGLSRSKITVLQCTTNYPAPFEETNLRAMVEMGLNFSVDIGFSDHTEGIEAALAAVALGAKVIEKHLTLDKELPGPDHRASANPTEFRQMVEGIRKVEKLLGTSVKKPTQSELANREIVRKSIVATETIKQGELFTSHNIGVRRPADGLSPMNWNKALGTKASKDYSPNERIELP